LTLRLGGDAIELPPIDAGNRPSRFRVTRGARGARSFAVARHRASQHIKRQQLCHANDRQAVVSAIFTYTSTID
jgi:hypothetical protein